MKLISMLLFAAITFSSISLFAQNKAPKADTTKKASYYTCQHHPDFRADKAGVCPKCGMRLTLVNMEQTKPEVFTCTMHPEVKSEKAGKCPKCGMNLTKSKPKTEPAKESPGHKH